MLQDEYIANNLVPQKDYTSYISLVRNLYIIITFDNWPAFTKPIYGTLDLLRTRTVHDLLLYPVRRDQLALLRSYPDCCPLRFFSCTMRVMQRSRAEIIVEDMIDQKKLLMFCFYCMDIDKDGYIDLGSFKDMMVKAFDDRLMEEKINKIYELVATDRSKRLNMEKFTDIVNVMQSNKGLFDQEPREFWLWNKFLEKINKYLKLNLIVGHWIFECIMFAVVLGNSVIMVWILTDPQESTLAILTSIDDQLLYVYTAEIVLRILATGIIPYFKDPWNQFDFLLVCISFGTDVAVNTLKIAKNARTARFLKISKLQRTLRITRSAKGVRIFKFCMGLLSSFYRIQQLIKIIIISIPTIWRTFSLILMMFYFYGIIGMEYFREANLVYSQIPPFGISNFSTFATSLLELAHVMIANSWSDLMYSWCLRYDTHFYGYLFFISFNAIINIVLRSLLSGLVWEVFSFVEKNSVSAAESDKMEMEVEMFTKNLKKNYFHELRNENIIMLYTEDYELNNIPNLHSKIDIFPKVNQNQGKSKRLSDYSQNAFAAKIFPNIHERRASLINPIYTLKSNNQKKKELMDLNTNTRIDEKSRPKQKSQAKLGFKKKESDGSEEDGDSPGNDKIGMILPPLEPPAIFGRIAVT